MESYRLWVVLIIVIILILLLRIRHPFIPTILVNLDRNPGRLFFMSSQLDLHGIPFTRYTAVDGQSYKFTDEEKQLLYGIFHSPDANGEPGSIVKPSKEEALRLFNKEDGSPKFKRTKGVMACALSHLQIWRQSRNSLSPVFIMEDDSILHPQLRQHIMAGLDTLNAFDPEWDIIWVSGKHPGDREIVTGWGPYNIYRMDPPEYIGQGCIGYILSPKGVTRFLNKLDVYGCSYPSDQFLIHHLDPKHSYGVNPPLVDNYSLFKSSITGKY